MLSIKVASALEGLRMVGFEPKQPLMCSYSPEYVGIRAETWMGESGSVMRDLHLPVCMLY